MGQKYLLSHTPKNVEFWLDSRKKCWIPILKLSLRVSPSRFFVVPLVKMFGAHGGSLCHLHDFIHCANPIGEQHRGIVIVHLDFKGSPN